MDGSNKHVLITINPATAVGIEIGPTGVETLDGTYQGYNTAPDMCFRNSDHVLYAYTFPGDGLATINLSAGAMTQLGHPSGASNSASCPTNNSGACTVNPMTVKLAGAPVQLKPNRTPMALWEDVNGDSRLDLVHHFDTQELHLVKTDTEAILTGELLDHTQICGKDTVRIVE